MNPCGRICSPEPRLSAIRPFFLRADDRVRTGDLNLGKVPRYQLRYIRVSENEIYPKPLPSTNSASSFSRWCQILWLSVPKLWGMGGRLDSSMFWMDGKLAVDLLEVSHDPAALDRPGFWAVTVSFEGRWTCARFGTVVAADFPDAEWASLTGRWESSSDQIAYVDYVNRIREAIASGEVYQVNACRILENVCDSDLQGLFALLLKDNPAPYASYLRIPGLEIASASPELFLQRTKDSKSTKIKSSPIKGTSTTSQFGLKDQAENIMIVDLMRNDFGQISKPGSVDATRLLGVEEHPGLFHLVSDVEGVLIEGTTWNDISQALLPPGSVSGAPKSSAVKMIAAVEKIPRGPYCGALGWVEDGNALLSVGIRIFWKENSMHIRFGTGAGITWGSDPLQEWEETELKARHLIKIAGGEGI